MAAVIEPPFLVIRLSSLGDIARLLPALRALKSRGSHTVDLTVEDRFAPLTDLFPLADRVIPYPRKKPGPPSRHPLAWSRAVKRYLSALRDGRYGTAIDLHGIARSAIVARLSGAALKAGYASDFGKELSHLFYDIKISPAENARIPRFERYAGALRELGLPEPSGEYFSPALSDAVRDEVTSFVRELGVAPKRYVFAFLGTSRAQARKRWPAERFIELARLTMERCGLPTLLGWGPEEEDLVRTLPRDDFLFPIPSWDLPHLLGAIERAAGFVGADTGAMHLSALMGIPTLALLGPTDPILNRPFGDRSAIVHREGILRACRGESCPHLDCMGKIGAEEVYAVLQELLERA